MLSSPSSFASALAPTLKHTSEAPERMETPKKPRHRHAAYQLEGLNELYERTEHPSLEERTELAKRLKMETKTVSSWFQNKRASCKKRTKGTAPPTPATSMQYELPPIASLMASVPAPQSVSEYDELSEDEHYYPRLNHSSASMLEQHALFYAGAPHSEQSMPRKVRTRPTHAQTEELRKLYDINPHPSKEEREKLGEKIGMRYQSVTNWFQNQRSIAKKRKEEEELQDALVAAAHPPRAHTYSSFPPTSGAAAVHPSLAVPPTLGHPSLPPIPHARMPRRSASAAPAAVSSRSSSPRPSPYSSSSSASHARPRRVRPEPHQLEALKKLFRRTATPSIEERGALALEIGMDVGKVTNWFRNLRQTTRKRAQKASEMEDDDYEMDQDSMDVADDVSLATYDDWRSVSPMNQGASSASSSTSLDTPIDSAEDIKVKIEHVEKQRRVYRHVAHANSHSDMGSDEDYQEAVTPSPSSSPPPSSYRPAVRGRLPAALEKLAYASEMAKPSVEDALLLLSFHQHAMH